MANETILIVDADTKSQKVLEVSFKKAGYRVVMTDDPARARAMVEDVSPDIIISDTQFKNGDDGFEFLTDLKTGAFQHVPFIFLTEERALPQKMKGFELGADDYLTKPIYIKEVTTRVELLLQKRAKEQLSEEDVEELEGNLADITMIDLLQTIEEELRSGTIHLTREGQSAVIYFREGNILDAICGKLQGAEAIYRLMLWPDGVFVLRYHDQVRRVDRIEKDSGALLLEGIRRLDQYNTLLDELPNLHHVFEADYQALSAVIDQLPDEVGRILRLFDGLRSIREVADSSPVHDVTTLQIVKKLLDDGYLTDVTPSARRSERPSRSNLATWLDGVRSSEEERGLDREDTSPKFGSTIAEMSEKRSTQQTTAPRDTVESTQPAGPRPVHDTDPFGSRSQVKPRRRTLPLKDAFDTIDAWEDEDDGRDMRRKTALQWDRPRSEWNIHFDAADNNTAAIREIEQEERRRREEEARQLSDVTRAGTLRFAPAQDRASGGAPDDDVLRQIEEDERRRRDEEARRLQSQLSSTPEAHAPRRRTDELPAQARVPAVEVEEAVDTDELFADASPHVRERPTTPLSSPALHAFEEVAPESEPDEGWDALAASDASDGAPLSRIEAVSEADVFDDDSDELGQPPPPPPNDAPDDDGLEQRRERVTLDIRPALSGDDEAEAPAEDVTPAGLFEHLGDEDTAPAPDDMEELAIEVIEVLPAIDRHSVDNELVRANYDLSLRKTIAPHEIAGRPEAVAEHPTMQLRAPAFNRPDENKFFASDSGQFEYHEPPSSSKAVLYVVLTTAAILVVMYIGFFGGKEEPAVTPPGPIAQNTVTPDPVETIAPPPQVVPPVVGLNDEDALAVATGYGAEVSGAASQLTRVLSGADLLVDINEDPTSDPLVAEKPPEVAVNDTPPVERPPVEKPPAEKPPVQEPTPKITTASNADVQKAERLVKQEKYDEALALLRQLSEAAPRDQKIAYLHGYAAFSSNKNGEAVTHLGRAERLGYRTAPLYLDLAAAYQLDLKHDRAKWAYEKFLELQPNGKMADEVRTILSTRF